MVRIQKLIVSPPNESSAMARATSRRIISLSAPGGQPPIGEIREPGTAINLLPRGTTGGYPSHPLLLPARTFLCDRAARAWLAMSQRGVKLASVKQHLSITNRRSGRNQGPSPAAVAERAQGLAWGDQTQEKPI